jgi:thiol-disulfide isomerase/thioredoxin
MRTTPLLAALLVAACAATTLAQPQNTPAQPAVAANPQHSPDAIAVLRAAAQAVKDGYSASIRSHFAGEGPLASMFATTEGRWAQKALGDDAQWAARHTGFGTVGDNKDPVDFDALWLPDRVSWIDNEDQAFNVQPLKGGKKSGAAHQLANNPWDRTESLAQGFAKAFITASAIDIRDSAEIEGTTCDVVAITDKPGSDPVLWYFGRADHLPRRCEIVLPENPMLNGAMRVDFTDGLAGTDATTDADWEITAPANYEQNISRRFQELSPPDGSQPTKLPARGTSSGIPDWEVPDSEGALVSPGSLRGKVSVLYFWGTWSPACKKTTPEVAALAEAYADTPVEVISMAFRENDADTVVDAARKQGQTWRQVPAADDAVTVLGIRAAPSIIIWGQQGELLYKSGRPKSDYTEMFTTIRAIIDRALSEEPTEDAESANPNPSAQSSRQASPAATTRIKPGGIKKKDE